MHDPKSLMIFRLLSRFTYPQKFILISILFGISLIITGYFMIKAQNTAIRFTELEIKGNTYERAIRKLLEDAQAHQELASRYLTGDPDVKSDLFNLSSEINADFKNLVAIDSSLQKQLATASEDFQLREIPSVKPIEIEKKWEDLNKHLSTLSPEASIKAHDELIRSLRTLMLHIGETGNLILDPALESNYFIDAVISTLPQAQLLIPQLKLLGRAVFSKQIVSDKEKEQLIILTASLQNLFQNTKSDFEKGFLIEKNLLNDSELESKLNEPLNEYLDTLNAFLAFIQNNLIHTDKPIGKLSDFIALGNKVLDRSFALWDATIDQLDKMLKLRVKKYRMQQYFSLAISLLSAIIGFILGIIVMREISAPLNRLLKAAKRLAQGDLSTRVDITYQDEVGQVGIAFNQMAESFQELIGKLQWTGIQLTTSTTEIAAAAKQQEATIVEQEATTKEIALTANEISSAAKDFAKTMNDISSAAEQASALATSGKAGLGRMETVMRQMVEASQNIAAKLAVLNERAGSITSVITTITKVADQTNLLSLNAAIEAEKAGEHGRSFSVIAREIRRLADQTANATLDIEKMVTEMVSAVSAGVMSVDKFSEEIHTGVSQVNLVGEQLSKILEHVQQQTENFEYVNKGMQAQSISAEQINDSINQLSEAAQQASESIRQFHNAIEQLNNAAQEMQATVSKIKR